jgi:hypothetical protein
LSLNDNFYTLRFSKSKISKEISKKNQLFKINAFCAFVPVSVLTGMCAGLSRVGLDVSINSLFNKN